MSNYVQNSFTSLTFDVQFQMNPPPSPNDNQSIIRKHNSWMRFLYVSGLSVVSIFVSSINSLILFGFPLASFHLAVAKAILTPEEEQFQKIETCFSSSSYS